MLNKYSYKIFQFLFVVVLTVISGCSNKQQVDSIFINGNIYSQDRCNENINSIAILNGKIIAIGETESILKSYETKNIVDLKDNYVYPGFNDAHCHFVGYAGDMFKCQLFNTKSFEDVVERLVKYSDTCKSKFIYGRGWNQNDWTQKSFPTNELVNKTFPNKVVFLKRIDSHAALINQKLFEQAKDVLQPFINTNYVQKKNGKPTGIIFDNAMEAVENLLPKIPTSSLIKNLLIAQKDCFQLGITSVSDAGLSYEEIKLVDSLQKAGLLKIKVNAMMYAKEENIKKYDAKPIKNTNRLRIQSLKIYADGALGSRGACLKKPYSDDEYNSGKINIDKKLFDTYCLWAIKNKFQVCTHAIGDSTVSFALTAYQKHLSPNNNNRWRIEHVQVCSPLDIPKFKRYNVIASVQPTHATSDMYWAVDRLGVDRISTAYTYGTFVKNKIAVALGTDFPVEYLKPLYTFYAAVSRKDEQGEPTNGFQMKDALTRNQTIKGMTEDGAYAEFNENSKGKIAVGYDADFVIVNFNLMKDDLLKIRNSEVTDTYLNGVKVYSTQIMR